MRIAHLILAHTNPKQLERLVKKLQHHKADFYIHIDAKTDIEPFLYLEEFNQVTFIKKREKVFWGAYSIVQATINSFEEILASEKKYSYINLLSGQDYPLQSAESIYQYLNTHQNQAFTEYLLVEDEWHEAITRLSQYHFTDYKFVGKYFIERIIKMISPKRKLPNDLIAVGRSQWFTIAPVHASYIVAYLQNNKKVKRFFKLTWGSDEIIFQTILYNSPFRKDMVNDNLRYIDWSEKQVSPKTLTMQDADLLMNSGKLFARKFNESVDIAILDYIDSKTQ